MPGDCQMPWGLEQGIEAAGSKMTSCPYLGAFILQGGEIDGLGITGSYPILCK